MRAPAVVSETPPQFHPEFGYLCPAPQLRRTVRIAIISTVCGALVGAIAVLVGMPPVKSHRTDFMEAETPVSTPNPASTPKTVGRGAAARSATADLKDMATTGSGAIAAAGRDGCAEQTWPYLQRRCLSGADSLATSNPMRVLRPDQPAESARAMVTPTTSPDEKATTAKADVPVQAQAARKVEKRHRRVRHVRRQPVNPQSYEAYASPYRDRYYAVRRDGWSWN